MQTGIIVQARTGSTRLPNKVLLPFYKEQCILDIILQKLKTLNYPVVVATSSHPNDNKIVKAAKKIMFKFSGLARKMYSKGI